jgi:restriction system protein
MIVKKPSPEDFGIDEKDVNRKNDFSNKCMITIVSVSFVSISLYFGVSAYIEKWNVSVSGVVGVLFLSSVLSLFSMFPLGLILFLGMKLNKTFRSVSEYEKAKSNFNRWWVRTRSSFWHSLDGRTFELEVANLLNRLGMKAHATKQSGDGGIDVIADDGNGKIIIQCKRYKKPIGPSVVRELFGVMLHCGAERGSIFASGGFTKGARDFAEGKNIKLVDLYEILQFHMNIEKDSPDPSLEMAMLRHKASTERR